MLAVDHQTQKSSSCGCKAPPPARAEENSAAPNPVWQSLSMRSGGMLRKLPGNQSCHRCQQEIDPAAANTMTGDQFHHEHQCAGQPDPDKPQRKPLTEREKTRAFFGLITAKSIASKAWGNLGRRDPYHLKKAEQTFQKPVSFETIDKHVALIRSTLDRMVIGQNVVAATCDEKQCNDGFHNAVAVTLDDLSAVLLCPFFFVQPGRTLATTILHEAGHMANIDVHFQPGKEQYCRPDDTILCDNICPISGEDVLENVDAWMRFIYCVAMS